MEFTVIIMRGTSGSGKSSYAKKHYPDAVVCSADNFFIQKDGTYKFRADLLGRAHKTCHESFVKALRNKARTIVVDNTNTTLREYKHYLQDARNYGYDVLFVRLDTPVDVAAKRNAHGVPLEAVERMANRMDEVPDGCKEIVVSGTTTHG
jgi:predicted kinase